MLTDTVLFLLQFFITFSEGENFSPQQLKEISDFAARLSYRLPSPILIEKIDDKIFLFLQPQNLWAVVDFEPWFNCLFLLFIFLPLFYCFGVLMFLLRIEIYRNYFGWFDFSISKTSGLWIFTLAWWNSVWSYVYLLLPRYEAGNVLNWFPNPRFIWIFLKSLSLYAYRPNYTKPLLWSICSILVLFTIGTGSGWLLLISSFLGLYLYINFFLVLDKITLKYYRWKQYNNKKNIYTWPGITNFTIWQAPLMFYPLLASFFLFFLATLLVIMIYCRIFFHPIVTWNGYFAESLTCFFFNAHSLMPITVPVTLDYFIGLDGLNLWLLWLTALLTFLCALYLVDGPNLLDYLNHLGWIFLLSFASFQFFCVTNYLWMYIFFELSLLPIFVLIVFWGSNRWKIHAAYQMVLFTFIGSVFLLAGIFLLFIKIWSFNSFDIFLITHADSLNLIFSTFEKKLIWLCLFIGFAVKTPLYPFHIWLPEAHSEAPTTGSVMLAGVLLKMGTYGFLWFVLPLFPSVLETFRTLVFSMCLCGILLSSLAALAQIDIKKIIAYSSIGHMGMVILGAYTLNFNGLLGASYMMLSHGLISSALFFSIGLLYKIYGTRSLIYYNSLAHFMPRFSMAFFIFTLANMGFPGTAGFPGELLIFTALVGESIFLSVLVGIGSLFTGVYSIWLLTWILYGQISTKISIYRDLKASEWKIVNFLVILIIFFGLFPFIILDFLKPLCGFFLSLVNH